METITVVAYVGEGCYTGQLMAYDSGEYLRRATPAECRASNDAGADGAFRTGVSVRTVARRAPDLCRVLYREMRGATPEAIQRRAAKE